MQGFPKNLNTKEDYLNIRSEFPDEWKPEWQALLDTMKASFPVSKLASKEAGKTTNGFSVVEMQNGDKTEYWQYEEKVNPTCKLLRLGFTEKEVRDALKD